MPDSPLRYVVLHHTGHPHHGEPHYDLMLEQAEDEPLLSIRLPAWPPAEGMHIEWTPPHRRVYLDYEGPVSNNRGHVRRIASGTYRMLRSMQGAEQVLTFSEVPGVWVLTSHTIECAQD